MSKTDYTIEAKQVEGFASKLEWHVKNFLEEYKIKFIYEYKTFKTKKGMYTPDFYLIDCDAYIEVKPFLPKEDDTYWDLFEVFVKENKTNLFIITPNESATLSSKYELGYDPDLNRTIKGFTFFKIKSTDLIKVNYGTPKQPNFCKMVDWPNWSGGNCSENNETYTICYCSSCDLSWIEPPNVWLSCPKCDNDRKPYGNYFGESFKTYWEKLDQQLKDRRRGY